MALAAVGTWRRKSASRYVLPAGMARPNTLIHCMNQITSNLAYLLLREGGGILESTG